MKNINSKFSKAIIKNFYKFFFHSFFVFSFFENFLLSYSNNLFGSNNLNNRDSKNLNNVQKEKNNSKNFSIEEKMKSFVAKIFISSRSNDFPFGNLFFPFEKKNSQKFFFTGILIDENGYIAVPYSTIQNIFGNNFQNELYDIFILINGKEYQGNLIPSINQSVAFIKINFNFEKHKPLLDINKNFEHEIGNEVIKNKLINFEGKDFISSESSKIISNLENFCGKKCILLSSKKNESEIGTPIFDSLNDSFIGILDEVYNNFGEKIETIIPINVIKKYFEIEIFGKKIPEIGLSFDLKITSKIKEGKEIKELIVSDVSKKIQDIKINDKILKINGLEIFSHDDVIYAISDLNFGDTVNVQYFSKSENKIKNTKIILEKETAMNQKMIYSKIGSFLVSTFKNNKDLETKKIHEGINNEFCGVKIIKTENNLGLASQDVILKINGEKINDIETFEKKIKTITNENYSVIFYRSGIRYESKKEQNAGNVFSFFGPTICEEDEDTLDKNENLEENNLNKYEKIDDENYEV